MCIRFQRDVVPLFDPQDKRLGLRSTRLYGTSYTVHKLDLLVVLGRNITKNVRGVPHDIPGCHKTGTAVTNVIDQRYRDLVIRPYGSDKTNLDRNVVGEAFPENRNVANFGSVLGRIVVPPLLFVGSCNQLHDTFIIPQDHFRDTSIACTAGQKLQAHGRCIVRIHVGISHVHVGRVDQHRPVVKFGHRIRHIVRLLSCSKMYVASGGVGVVPDETSVHR